MCERIFIKTHSIDIRFVIELENVLSAGVCVCVCVHFSVWGSEGVNASILCTACSDILVDKLT